MFQKRAVRNFMSCVTKFIQGIRIISSVLCSWLGILCYFLWFKGKRSTISSSVWPGQQGRCDRKLLSIIFALFMTNIYPFPPISFSFFYFSCFAPRNGSLDARMADVQVCALHTGCLRGSLGLQPNCRFPGQVSWKHSLKLRGYELLLWDRLSGRVGIWFGVLGKGSGLGLGSGTGTHLCIHCS